MIGERVVDAAWAEACLQDLAEGGEKPRHLSFGPDRHSQVLRADFGTVDRLLADELAYTHANAKRDNKGAYLEPSEMSTRLYGEAAIVIVRMLSVALVSGAESRADLRFTSVWIFRDARWQMAAWQSARVP